MALLHSYPIVADLYTRAMRAPSIPSPFLEATCALEARRNKEIQADPYLTQAASMIGEYMRKFSKILPHQVAIPPISGEVVQISVKHTVTYFASNEYPQAEDSGFESVPPAAEKMASNEHPQAEDSSFESVPPAAEKIAGTGPLPVTNFDALLCLNFAELHSAKLMKVLSSPDEESTVKQYLKKWKEFKDYLTEFSLLLDKILQHYRQNIGKLPELKSLRDLKQKILKVVTPMSYSKVHKRLGEMLQFSAEELFVSALGLNSDVAKQLSSMDADIRCHETDFYHLRDIVCKSIEFHFSQNSTESSLDVLVKSGFTAARAKFLSDHIEEVDPSNHQLLAYWVEVYLNYMFQYDIFLAGGSTEFPHGLDKMNDWVEKPTKRYMENEDDDSDAEEIDDDNATVLNIPVIETTADRVCLLKKDGVKFPPADLTPGFWYHGTDFHSAESIRVNGVQILKGNGKQDFSDGNGFYVTPHFEYAVKWAGKKGYNSNCGVVVFEHKIDGNKHKGLDLTLDRDEDWRRVVKYYRSGGCHDFRCPKRLCKEMKAADFIEGPMSGDGTRYTNTNWQPSKKEGNESVQLCVKSQKLADEFSMKIVGIIFFCQASETVAVPT